MNSLEVLAQNRTEIADRVKELISEIRSNQQDRVIVTNQLRLLSESIGNLASIDQQISDVIKNEITIGLKQYRKLIDEPKQLLDEYTRDSTKCMSSILERFESDINNEITCLKSAVAESIAEIEALKKFSEELHVHFTEQVSDTVAGIVHNITATIHSYPGIIEQSINELNQHLQLNVAGVQKNITELKEKLNKDFSALSQSLVDNRSMVKAKSEILDESINRLKESIGEAEKMADKSGHAISQLTSTIESSINNIKNLQLNSVLETNKLFSDLQLFIDKAVKLEISKQIEPLGKTLNELLSKVNEIKEEQTRKKGIFGR